MRRSISTGLAAFCAVAAGLMAGGSWAACPSDEAVQALAANILAGSPSPPLDVATIEDGLCAQKKLVAILAAKWGKPIGYKAGLTSEAAQKTFNVREPVSGVLLADIMLPAGSKLKAKFGALPRFEADLIVVVADDAINKATTPKEVLAHLSAVRPFIELPDLMVDSPKKLSGPVIASINVGVRHGILGDAIPVEQTDAFLAALAGMKITVTDQDGTELASAPGSAVLGHPLNSVLWLRDSGIVFKAGDLISVGSFGPLLQPKAGLSATVTYDGLPGKPAIGVTFE